MTQFTKATCKVFYEEHTHQDYYDPLSDFMCSGPIIGMKLARLDAIPHWRKIIGPQDIETAKREAPQSLRARFATNGRENCVHGADKTITKKRELQLFFSNQTMFKRLPAEYPSTILTLTPKIIQDGLLGNVIRDIQTGGCKITAMQMFTAEQLEDLKRTLKEDSLKVIRKKVPTGHALVLDVTHRKGYNELLEKMLHVEKKYDTGFSHFDRGDEKLAERVFL